MENIENESTRLWTGDDLLKYLYNIHPNKKLVEYLDQVKLTNTSLRENLKVLNECRELNHFTSQEEHSEFAYNAAADIPIDFAKTMFPNLPSHDFETIKNHLKSRVQSLQKKANETRTKILGF